MRVVIAAGGAVFLCGCSYGLNETPRTLPPQQFSGSMGVSMVFNQNDAQRGGVGWHSVAPQLGPLRFGVAPRVDVGVATFYGLGFRGDVKVMLSRPTLRPALAVRAGAGGSWDGSGRSLAAAFTGMIASYTLGPLEPYAGVNFTNHWIWGQPEPDASTLAPGEKFAPREGYGDGLLQLTVGLRLFFDMTSSISLEYSRWQPMQDDPGDFYTFVPNDIVSLAVCIGCPGRRRALARVGIH